jgi:hypothetical protein
LKTINEHNKIEILNEVQEQMGSYLFEYNHLRRHGGLNYETPFDKLQKSYRISELVQPSQLFTWCAGRIFYSRITLSRNFPGNYFNPKNGMIPGESRYIIQG